MKDSEWLQFSIESYFRSLDHAEDLYPRYGLVLAAAVAIGAAHYALTLKLLSVTKFSLIHELFIWSMHFAGSLLLLYSVYHIVAALNLSGKVASLPTLPRWNEHRLNEKNRLLSDSAQMEAVAQNNEYYSKMEQAVLLRVSEAEAVNRSVIEKRLISARSATNCIIGSGFLSLVGGMLQIIGLFLERVL